MQTVLQPDDGVYYTTNMTDLADYFANKPFFSSLLPGGTGIIAIMDVVNVLLETVGLLIGIAVGIFALIGHLRKLK